jgi:hypothetical protein
VGFEYLCVIDDDLWCTHRFSHGRQGNSPEKLTWAGCPLVR